MDRVLHADETTYWFIWYIRWYILFIINLSVLHQIVTPLNATEDITTNGEKKEVEEVDGEFSNSPKR